MERKDCHKKLINNEFYHDLHENWYTSDHHPIALLRAENKVRNPWIRKTIKDHFPTKCSILDIGCGAGILTNDLVKDNHDVTGVDLSAPSLKIAEKYDDTKKVKYQMANAYDLPFKEKTFDIVCAMDVLEHVENPFQLIIEASRVLKHGGLFFFHTFHQNLLSYLFIIKCVDWFVPNAPKNMHVYNLFIKPKDLKFMCKKAGLSVDKIFGFQPKILSKEVLKMLFFKKLDDKFPFQFTKKVRTGYLGYAFK